MKLILVMHWAVKQNRKDKLLASNSVSLSIDDRKDYRIVRYRCSLPPPPQDPDSSSPPPSSIEEWCGVEALVAEGILGVYRVGADVPENSLESHDVDKSEAMAQTVFDVFRRAAQGPEGEVDDLARSHLKRSVRHFASDQGPSVAKAAKILATDGHLPSLVYLSFDGAHQIRIASKDPLHALPEFERQWQRLFGGKSALLPAIQHSKAWQAKLVACQNQVLKVHGTQGPLTKALQTMSFAAQRFDSSASPLYKFCSLIRAIAVLCGMQAVDVTWFVQGRSWEKR